MRLQMWLSDKSRFCNCISHGALRTSDVPRVLHSPYSLQLLLSTLLVLLTTSDKQMTVLRFASFNIHELIEFQHSPLAATPAFATFVEDGRTGMMHTALSGSVSAFVCRATSFSSAGHALLER